MSDENNNEYVPNGIPVSVFVLVFLFLVAAVSGDLYLMARTQPACVENDKSIALQAQANIAFANLQQANQKRLMDLQLEVIKQCVSKGNVPLLENNNVKCSIPTK